MLKQGLQQKLLQKLSPQQIQLIKLLQIPTEALEERLKEELEANPALEEGVAGDDEEEEIPQQNGEEVKTETEAAEEPTVAEEAPSAEETKEEEKETAELDELPVEKEEPIEEEDRDMTDYLDEDEVADYRTREDASPEQDDQRTLPIPISRSYHEYLQEQLGTEELNDHELALAKYLIGSIDDEGYLRRPLDAMVDDLAFSQNITTDEVELDRILKIIQRYDPPGTGARDLQECLLLQLKRMNDPAVTSLATSVITDYFDEFVKKHYEKLQRQLNVDDELFKQVINAIIHLNPKPGSGYTSSGRTESFLIPDFFISNNDGKLELSLNNMNVPDLRISQHFRDMLRDYQKGAKKDKKQREAVMFIKQKIDGAKWFIDALRQRQQTLLLVMETIMEYQCDYLLTGDETTMKPMILKDIADKTGLDISTVSRVANSKWVQTEWGTMKLKSFFSESLSTESGEEVSTREVKKILTDLISIENKKEASQR